MYEEKTMTPLELKRMNLELLKFSASIMELECRIDEYNEAIVRTQETIDSQKKKEQALRAKVSEASKVQS
jgi:hypothetical protein